MAASTMVAQCREKYRQVESGSGHKDDSAAGEDEVRITQQGKARSYIAYGASLLQDKGLDTIQLKVR